MTLPGRTLPVPWLSLEEDRLLRIIKELTDAVDREKARNPDARRPPLVETRDAIQRLHVPHEDGMKVINSLRDQGLLRLRPRQSAGLSGNGYDGALYAEVILQDKAYKELEKYPGPPLPAPVQTVLTKRRRQRPRS